MAKSAYKRILLKVSGEVLAGDQSFGIEPKFLAAMADQIAAVAKTGVQVAIVIGAGNIFRGMAVAAEGTDRVTADLMGMLGTVHQLAGSVQRHHPERRQGEGLSRRCTMPSVADSFTARAAKAALDDGFVVVCAGGTGNPFFTTDTAAALKAIELDCDVAAQGHQGRRRLHRGSQEEPQGARATIRSATTRSSPAICKVMDTAAFALARDNAPADTGLCARRQRRPHGRPERQDPLNPGRLPTRLRRSLNGRPTAVSTSKT